MAMRRAPSRGGAYVVKLNSMKRPMAHRNPVCHVLAKSAATQKIVRTNLHELEGEWAIFEDLDTARKVAMCKCMDEPDTLSRDWVKYAACRTEGVDRSHLFVNPGENGKSLAHSIVKAQAICAECPVRLHCAEYGAAQSAPRNSNIIWGGEMVRS